MQLSFIMGFSQAFDSTDYQIIHLQDTNISGVNRLFFKMTTQNNNMNSGYTDFIFIDQHGDSITSPTNWSMWLPVSNNSAFDTASYILYYKVGVNSFPSNFNGHLKILNPSCTIPFSLATLGTTEIIDLNPDIKLFPNPTTDRLRVLNKSNFSITSIEVYSSSGKLVLSEDLSTDFISINTLKPGAYFVKLHNKERVVAFKKLIKD